MPAEIEVRDAVTGERETFNTKRDRYRAPATGEQIRTVATRGTTADYARLIQLVAKFYKGRVTDIPRLLTQSDAAVYDELRRRFPRTADTGARDDALATNIYRTLRWHMPHADTVLDVGCNRGGITLALGRMLGAKRIVGADVVPSTVVNRDVEYHQIRDGRLPVADASVDLVTANMTLHHIADVEQTIREIHRVLRPGGTFYIREHDCWTAMDAMLIDIEHLLYDRVGGDPGEYQLYHYTNYHGWDRIVAPFEFVAGDYFYSSVRNDISPTRAFWRIYTKPLNPN